MKNALTHIVSSIVTKSDSVVIDEKEEEGIITFIIHVDPIDMGKIIGKEGKVIRAIRNAMKIPAIKQNKKIHIEIANE